MFGEGGIYATRRQTDSLFRLHYAHMCANRYRKNSQQRDFCQQENKKTRKPRAGRRNAALPTFSMRTSVAFKKQNIVAADRQASSASASITLHIICRALPVSTGR